MEKCRPSATKPCWRSASDKTRAELRFAAGASVRERLETIVEREGRCCPFLELRLSEHADVITLHVQAPEGAEMTLSEITGAFNSETQAAAR